jgi:hypothetical protein
MNNLQKMKKDKDKNKKKLFATSKLLILFSEDFLEKYGPDGLSFLFTP